MASAAASVSGERNGERNPLGQGHTEQVRRDCKGPRGLQTALLGFLWDF